MVIQDAVRGELSALAAGLKRRKEAATARGLLELLQELAHVAGKVSTRCQPALERLRPEAGYGPLFCFVKPQQLVVFFGGV